MVHHNHFEQPPFGRCFFFFCIFHAPRGAWEDCLSKPLKSYRNPIGKDGLPTIFQGRAVKLRGRKCRLSKPSKFQGVTELLVFVFLGGDFSYVKKWKKLGSPKKKMFFLMKCLVFWWKLGRWVSFKLAYCLMVHKSSYLSQLRDR